MPADFVQDGRILKGLPGLLTVLRDAGYGDEDALQCLFTPDDSLPGTPVAALRAQTLPNKPIRYIVPVAAGGGSDMVGRTVTERFSDHVYG